MNAFTAYAWIRETKAEVFDFLANAEHLPLWANVFCQGIAGGRSASFRVESDSRTGVIDVWFELADKAGAGLVPLRVFDTDRGRSVVMATWLPWSGQSEAAFARGCDALQTELAQLEVVLNENLQLA